jgi:hypothetical protein
MHLQIYDKIQHDKSSSKISGASEWHLHNFPFSQYFSIQHLEKHGKPMWVRESKTKQKPK